MDTAALYSLIICASCGHLDVPSCQWQLPSYKAMARQECVERLQIIRFRQPHHRVVCLTPSQPDVIDSAGELGPDREGNRMDMLGMPPGR